MQKTLLYAFLLPLVLCGACQSSDSKTTVPTTAAPETAAADTAAVRLRERVAHPQVGDVYVVQFQRPDNQTSRYFFYHVFRATPDTAYLHPAYKDAATADADLRQPEFRASDQTMIYTQAELLELLQVQAGDVNKARLVQVRRAQ
ncbi:hypothetical protein [Hymenobacter chitinivorans]|uniref:Lipoprotein n=1 Tax=Hymenobacter chitinivorans DSM 11115 TaxID=1121954 RepID=A0A2M9BMK0_9BACT|nr:hypothetical protein [Hymenobacter chitinivorans]PJJ59155.1 hypothetical protein CLV45_0570 [Hymenobacter chitinivorans DSM 11115]